MFNCRSIRKTNLGQPIYGDDLIYKIGTKKTSKRFDFQNFIKIRSFGTEIYEGFITLNEKTEKPE